MALVPWDSKDIFDKVLDSIPDMIAIHDEEKMLYVNTAGAKLLGEKKPGDVVGRNILDFVHPENRDEIIALMHKIPYDERHNDFTEGMFVRRDGRVIHFEIFGSPITYEGKPARQIVLRDITERKKIEDDLDSTDSTLSALIENSDDATLISDDRGRPILWNKTYARIIKEALGIDIKKGLQPHKLLKDKDAIAWWDNLHRRVLGGESFRVEYSHEFGKGDIRWFEVSYRPIFKNKYVTGFTEFSRDITERKKAEDALRETNEKLKSIFKSSPDFIVELDLDANILFVNKTLEGYSIEEVIGRSIYDLNDEENNRILRDCFTRVIKTGENDTYRISFELTEGTLSYFEGTVSPILKDGKVASLLANARDITERKKAEEELKESEETHRLIFQETPIGIVHVDAKGVVTACNPALSNIMGAPTERIVGLDLSKKLADKRMRKAVKDLLAGVEGYFEGPYTSVVAGKKAYLKAHFTPIKSDDGSVIGGIGTFEDITSRKEFEQDIENRNRELELLQHINHLIASGTDISRIYQELAKGLTSLPMYNASGIYLLDKKTNSLLCVAYDIDSRKADRIEKLTGLRAEGYMVPLFKNSFLSTILISGSPHVTDEIPKIVRDHTDSKILKKLSKKIASLSGVKYGIGVPMKVDEEVIGLIGVGSADVLSLENARRLDILSDQIAFHIERYRLDRRLKREMSERVQAQDAALKSEERFRNLMQTSPDMLFVIDPATDMIIDVNPAVIYSLGYEREEVMGSKAGTRISSAHKKKFQTLYSRFKKTGKFEGELDLIRKDGTLLPVEVRGIATKNYMFASARDVTIRKRTQKELEEYKDSLEELVAERTTEIKQLKDLSESIIETTPMCVVVVDNDLVVKHWNKYTEDYVNLKKEAIVGKKMFEVIPSLKKLGWEQVFRKVIDTGEPFKVVDYEIKRTFGPHKGETWYQNIEIVPIYLEGEIHGALELLGDVTAKKKAEIQVSESEERYRSLVESAKEAILTIDSHSRITSVNAAWTQITGFSKKAWIGKDLSGWIHPESHAKATAIVKSLRKGSPVSPFEMKVLTKNGYITGEFTANTLSKGGQFSGVSFIGRDITARKKAEDEMKRNLMKYDIKNGQVYLVKEFEPVLSVEAFKDVLKIGLKGLVISRSPEEEIVKRIDVGTYDYFWMSEEKEKELGTPLLVVLLSGIGGFDKGSAVLIDRLDYLIAHYGFKRVLSFVQRIREIAFLSDFVIIMSIDPGTIGKREMRLLEKEGNKIETLSPHRLPEDLLEIIRTLYNSNLLGVKPSHTEIGNELKVSRPTIRKRVRRLVKSGYVLELSSGRKKVLELTDKGYNIFKK